MSTPCLSHAEPVPIGAHTTLQFAVGGLALPPPDQWLALAEKVRGRAVRNLCRSLTGNSEARYRDLTAAHRLSISLISGKDSLGQPLCGHRHSHFFLVPDEFGQPSRLIAWRRAAPFTNDEVQALVRSAERPVVLAASVVYLVPLALGTRLPPSVSGPARIWRSATPFVPPSARHRFRNGRVRDREKVERLAERFLSELGLSSIESVTACAAKPVRLHVPRNIRTGASARAVRLRTGYEIHVEFSEPAAGPILIGDSCHFGLGLLRAVEETHL